MNAVALVGALLVGVGLFSPWVQAPQGPPQPLGAVPELGGLRLWLIGIGGLALLAALGRGRLLTAALLVLGLVTSALALLGFKVALGLGYIQAARLGFWLVFGGGLLVAAGAVTRLSLLEGRDRLTRFLRDVLPPAAVPVALFACWEAITEGLRVPLAFFPRVSDVYRVLISASDVLLADSARTFVQQVLAGYLLGVTAGVVLGVVVAFSRFMQRGFLPLATAFSAIPIVGLAPVLGRALGVDWQSKAAVAVIVSFFPVLINVVQGLTVIDPLKLDLMRSYAARPHHVLRLLRFPNALPYVFNALKIASIIVLISVIVAEFLIPGPPQGLGQRISLSARSGRYDVTFAAIAYASVIGILFYNAIALLERLFTFWHSSFRDARR